MEDSEGRIDDRPEAIDCAVLAIPGAAIVDAVRACARRRVGALIIFSATKDIRLLPPEFSEETIIEELLKLKSSALLRGFRGSLPIDLKAVAAIVARLAQMTADCSEILEVDINPVIAYAEGQGAIALDALILTTKSAQKG